MAAWSSSSTSATVKYVYISAGNESNLNDIKKEQTLEEWLRSRVKEICDLAKVSK